MSKFLFSCGGATFKKRAPKDSSKIQLASFGPDRNVSVKISKLQDNYAIPDRLYDLLSIASFVYSADTRASRGNERDVFEDRWVRELHFAIPVVDLPFWTSPGICQMLKDTLGFATGDNYEFEFVQTAHPPRQQIHFDLKDEVGPLADVNVINMFSGGVDSLAAAIESVNEGLNPLLVSHLPVSIIGSRHSILIKELKKRYGSRKFPHFSIWVSNTRQPRTVEYTQRSRSFLFLALGTTAAVAIGVDEIRLCDNGVVSLNLPQSSQTIGASASRSTHPEFMWQAEELLRRIADRPDLTICNTLLFKTKAEVMTIIRDSGHPELLQETVSCGRTRLSSIASPHCGVCSQCIDRRFATKIVGMEEHDLTSMYAKDIFVDAVDDGNEKTYLTDYVLFARRMARMPNPQSFLQEFPELANCVRPDDPDVEFTYRQFWDLFQRHQQGITGALKSHLVENTAVMASGKVAPNTLLDIIRLSAVRDDVVVDTSGATRPRCHVLLVVATDIERDHTLASFKKLTGQPSKIHHGSRLSYHYLGKVSGAQTYLVQSEMGSSSPGASTVTVTQAIGELDPKAIILEGIAFGVDSSKQAIGDIIVSKQLLSYEQQRLGTDGDGSDKVILRGDKATASNMLLQRCHAAVVSWRGASVSFALVLSGDKLVDNVGYRQQLIQLAPEAKGGEMEGTGLYAAAHNAAKDWIVIKAICDWADGAKRDHKSERQSQAAQAAADFTAHVVSCGGLAG